MLECFNLNCSNCEEGKCKKDNKECSSIKTKMPEWVRKQLEYAKDKENSCYQKECSGNIENQCTVKDRICISRVAEPINYEEEYKKLKAENEKLREANKCILHLEKQLENELGRNRVLKEKLESTVINNHEAENNKLRCQYEEAKQHIERLKKEIEENNEVLENEYQNKLFIAEQKINSLNTENAYLKAFKEKADKRIQYLIDAIKNIAKGL